ncbi:MAG: DNA-binding IclR family transcriptional regulator [Sulfitobacter sp.]|jgi:DNA-binding IclR family transcriptional regulator
MDGDASRETIPTNLRLLLVLEEIAKAGVPITPTTVNASLELPKPTIHRLFSTLEDEGFLQRDVDGKTYSPGPRLRVLASGVLSSLRIRTARQAILKRLSKEIGETCNIAIADRDAMIYLERVETEWPLRIQLPQGTRVPFHCTASGKMYLSALAPNHMQTFLAADGLEAHTRGTITDAKTLAREIETVRDQGYALDREEFMDSMIAVAVPIADPHGRLMSTLSFHAPTLRFDMDRALGFLDALRIAAAELSRLVTSDDPLDA